MTIVRRLARPLLAAAFIQTGISTLRHPGPEAERVRPLVDQVAEPLHLPRDPELLLRVDGALLIGAGGLLALGRFPRLAGLVLAAGAAPATYGDLTFWREKDPQLRLQHRNEALTRLGLIGGALLAAVDTGGRPGLRWRSRQGRRQAELAGRAARARASAARAQTQRAVERTRRQAAGKVRSARQALPV